MTQAAATAVNVDREDGASAESGHLLERAMGAPEEAAKDSPLHHAHW